MGLKLRVAILTDLHAHPRNMNEADLASIVARTNGLQPDVTVLLGDYGSQSPGPVAPEVVAGLMRGLVAPAGVYAIQGNHDWTDDPDAMRRKSGPTRVERAFRAAGIAFLENQAVPLGSAPKLWIAGIESEATRSNPRRLRHDPERLDRHRTDILARMLGAALRPMPAVILLAHEPDIFATRLDPEDRRDSCRVTPMAARSASWAGPPGSPRPATACATPTAMSSRRDAISSSRAGSAPPFVAGRPLRIGVPPEIVLVELGFTPGDGSAPTHTERPHGVRASPSCCHSPACGRVGGRSGANASIRHLAGSGLPAAPAG